MAKVLIVKDNLIYEARTTTLLADGLSPMGNFVWYFKEALPNRIIGITQTLFLLPAFALILWQREGKAILLLVYVGSFMVGISLAPLHRPNWLIPILPFLALFLANLIVKIAASLATQTQRRNIFSQAVVGVFLLISLEPIYRYTGFIVQGVSDSIRIQATNWAVKNLVPGTRIVTDPYTIILPPNQFEAYEQSWDPPDKPLKSYIDEGYEYIFLNIDFYKYQYQNPTKYKTRLLFYEKLFDQGTL